MSVAVCRAHFDDVIPYFEDRNVERSATKIEHGNFLVFLFVEPIGKRCCGRFVNDALYVEARDLSGIFCRLPLGIVEISWHCDDCLRYLLAKFCFSISLQFLEYHRRNLFRTIPLISSSGGHFYFNTAVCLAHLKWHRFAVFLHCWLVEGMPDEALYLIDSVFRVCNGLTARKKSHKPFACF